ncbi:hypothetical protein C2S51_007410 [Perilla frutescens var. frutescens]|nr:hypothetical protein C2S51_007410 [Perilla frutescens var. frutescens]
MQEVDAPIMGQAKSLIFIAVLALVLLGVVEWDNANDNFSPQLHEAIFQASKELFDLPTHLKILNTSDTPSHGYVGQELVIPFYEGLGIEDATTEEGVQSFTTLLWPSGNDTFRETVLEYSKVMADLDEVVMRMVCEVYGITNSYEPLRETTSYLLRLIKYRRP